MSDDNTSAWDAVRGELDTAQSSDSADQALPHLRAARDSLDALINDTLAETILGGASIRSAAALAGFAENTIRPRLGQSETLAPYADASGAVSASSIARARHDYGTTDGLVNVTAVSGQMKPFTDPAEQARKPLAFTPRASKRGAYTTPVRDSDATENTKPGRSTRTSKKKTPKKES